jgi:hypothetical protein
MKYVNKHIFSHLTRLSQKNRGWWRKTTYIFEFSVKSSIRIRYFFSWDKKKLNFVDQCSWLAKSVTADAKIPTLLISNNQKEICVYFNLVGWWLGGEALFGLCVRRQRRKFVLYAVRN